MKSLFRIEAVGKTDVGRVREHNEDDLGVFPELGLFFVADGMGGHRSGDIASRLAVAAMRELFEQTASRPDEPLPFPIDERKSHEENRLVCAVKLANRRLLELVARERVYSGLGSTIAAASIFDGRAQIAHVGDSRVSLLRDGRLRALTRDHTLINDYMSFVPALTPEEIEKIPKNIITRAIGMNDQMVVDSSSTPLSDRDVLLITTDGVHGLLEDAHMAMLLIEHPPATAAEKLIDAANRAGGHDNATCVVVRVTEERGGAASVVRR